MLPPLAAKLQNFFGVFLHFQIGVDRFLSYGESDYFIKNIEDALIGIVVGENIEPANENIVKILCNNICEVKKITFTYKGCQLTNIS